VAGLAGAGAAAALAQLAPSVASLGQWTTLRRVGRCMWRGVGPGVAFTFDDGPSPEATPALLDRLDELGWPATFFCLGSAVDRHPELVREIVRRGHQVGTHGYEHRHHLGAGPRWIGTDLDRAVAALDAVGVSPRWFRPPYGQISTGTVLAARRRGLGLALWSAWGREWDAPDAAAVITQVRRGLQPGAVVLLHDSDMSSPAGSARRALHSLGPLAEDMAAARLRPVTLDELSAGG
jgi:peptidoglycan/xylan/chitin deacetylase (PgdA/CDA1 family)